MTEELTVKNLFVTINGYFTGYCDLYDLNHSEQLLLMHFTDRLMAEIETVYGEK